MNPEGPSSTSISSVGAIASEKAGKGETERKEDVTAHYSRHDASQHGSMPGQTFTAVRSNVNAKLANPLDGLSIDELRARGRSYAKQHDLLELEDLRAFELGAILAQDATMLDRVREFVSVEEMGALEGEYTNKWNQPWQLYIVIVLCSLCAAVQGMDETVVNGAQIFYTPQFGIGGKDNRSKWLTGLTNGAPYLCCAVIGCWLTPAFNHWFGRRGTVFVTCLISAVACFWQGFVATWWHMFVARFVLGFGIGPKSATVPMYAAETTPPAIRGALVMQWQMWTAFGIMVGYAADLMFYHVPDPFGIVGLNWRLMMSSAMFPAVIVCLFVFMCPESPRWYISQGRHVDAYFSMCRLRHHKIQAARDVFLMTELIKVEQEIQGESTWLKKMKELFTVPRNRHAMQASQILMFMQQFCGVNVIAYYSSVIFQQANYSNMAALSASMGFGVVNFLGAIPAIWTIDTFGRRFLLATTTPLAALFLFFTGFSFLIPSHKLRHAFVALGIYLFGLAYSPGLGPVPFTYSAEAYPLHIRPYGMSLATATTWFFNFVLSVTYPAMSLAFTPTGAFSWYASWNIVGWFLVLFFVPETKGKSLEALDQVFSIPTRVHAAYGARQALYVLKRYILRRDVQPVVLHEREHVEDEGGEA